VYEMSRRYDVSMYKVRQSVIRGLTQLRQHLTSDTPIGAYLNFGDFYVS
jgi:hypothetical protein